MGLGRGARTPAYAALLIGLHVMPAAIPMAGCAVASPSPVETPGVAPAEVAWSTWSAESFAQADAEGRIILVNVVAGWCHWCHVMDEKTYGDPRVAKLLGERFVTIRVDSDARPDVAERYSAWGWPATAILTPDGQAVMELRGYQEPQRFLALLEDLARRQAAGDLEGRVEPPPPTPRNEEARAIRDALVGQLDPFYDEDTGGWGHRSQKYPLADPVEHAFARSAGVEDSPWERRALDSLEQMSKLIDPVWGGMYQYSLGSVWTEPHYEKIAAIQAGAVRTYSLAFARTGEDRWLERADAVVDYLETFMLQDGGGFASSQDADLRAGEQSVAGVEYYALDDVARRALGIPRVDTNVYADLNGQLIAALAARHRVEPEQTRALTLALGSAEAIERELAQPSGMVRHQAGDDSGVYYLRDQAAVGFGYLELFRVTGERRWFERARSLADAIVRELEDPERGGFWANTEDPAAVGVLAARRKPLDGNAWASRLLLGVHHHLDHGAGESTPYLESAARAIRLVSSDDIAKPEGRFVGPLVLAAEEWVGDKAWVTISGEREDPQTAALHRAALTHDDARLVIEVARPGVHYPDRGKAQLYVCTESACSQPMEDAGKVEEGLRVFVGNNL